MRSKKLFALAVLATLLTIKPAWAVRFYAKGTIQFAYSGESCGTGLYGVMYFSSSTNLLYACLSGSTWTQIATGSGGGTPGGSTTQVQFNNAGAFAGSANMIWDGTTFTVSHSAASATGEISGATSSTTAGAWGVKGADNGSTGAAYGVYGTSSGAAGYGVYGTNTLGGNTSAAVYGANYGTGTAYGVEGIMTTSANTCSGAQSNYVGRAIEGPPRRTLAETGDRPLRTLRETGRTIGETEAIHPGRRRMRETAQVG